VQAAGLTDDARERGALLDRAGWYAFNTADHQTAAELGEQAIAAFEEVGDTHAAARASGRLANVESALGRADEGLARIERAWAVVGDDEPDEDIGQLAVRFGGALVFAGELERAAEQLDRATAIGEWLGSPLVLAGAFNVRSILSASLGRQHERVAFLRQAIELAREHELEQLGTMYFNHSDAEFARDRYESALGHLDLALAEARRRGSRAWEWSTFSEITFPLFMLGRWDEAVARAADVPEDRLQDALTLSLLESITQIRSHRGDVAGARRLLSLYPEAAGDVQYSSSVRAARAGVLLAEGRLEEALAAALETLELVAGTDDAGKFGNQQAKQALVFAVEAALGLGRFGVARELVARVERLAPGARPPFLDAQAKRFRGRLDDNSGELAAATAAFHELGMTFWTAVCRLEHAELVRNGDLVEQARAEFERLGATPWLERADHVLAAERVSA
jgi:tetratricopeptide (TPR) repeat protein